jgi:predicted dehydrogenase
MTANAASDAVLSALRAKRIGTPVSVRIVDHAASAPDRLGPALGRHLEAASRWLGADVRRLAALGDLRLGPVSVLMEFSQGQTALVSVGTRGAGPPLVEVFVVGSRGILSWEPGPGSAPQHEPRHDPLSQPARRLLDAVRRSLASESPVPLAGEARSMGRPAAGERSHPAREQAEERSDSKHEKPRTPARSPLKPPYGVLLVAGGRTHQENYAEDFAADARCRLVGVTDEPDVPPRRRALNQKLARKLGIPWLPDLDEALAREDVQLASVCAEPERRARVMVRCAEAGVHLYLDKPMAASVDEAEAVAAAIRAAGVGSQMFSQVHWPASLRARRVVECGSLGDLQAIHFDLTFAKGRAGTVPIDKPRTEQPRPRQFERVDSKRELFNVGVYSLVQLQWLLGRRVRRVYAVTGNYFFAEHRRNDMEDFAVALMELGGGLVATLACGRTGWRSHPMGGLNRVCLAGTRGATSIDAYRPRVEVWADESPWLPPKTHPEDPMGFWKSTFEEMEAAPKRAWVTPPAHSVGDRRSPTDGMGESDAAHFLDCLEQGRESEVPARLAAAVVKVLMAAYESAATHSFVVPA